MPAGSQVSALVGFSNGGNRPLLVKAVRASIRNLDDFNYIYENYTVMDIGATVEAGEQASYMYKFTPGKALDPRNVAMEVVVDYIDDDDEDYMTDAAFNGTITITGSVQKMDMDQIIQLVFFALVFIGGAWYLNNSESGAKILANAGVSQISASKVETGTEATSDATDDDWAAAATSYGKKKKKGSK